VPSSAGLQPIEIGDRYGLVGRRRRLTSASSDHSDMDPALVKKITQALVAIDAQDSDGKAVLEGEGCSAFVPGITTAGRRSRKQRSKPGFLIGIVLTLCDPASRHRG
jgi:hypothetical protein